MEGRAAVTAKRGKETRMLTQESSFQALKTKWKRIMDRANRDKTATWTSLFHLLDSELLTQCFGDLAKNKAMGIDGIDKEAYGQNLPQNIADLVLRIRKGTYIPKPVRIVEIPKADGTKRPLAMSCIEDKVVQEGLKRILEAVYEPVFLDCSYGFRPGRGCDKALQVLNQYLKSLQCGAIVDIDIKSFFDNISHEKLIKLLEMKIKQSDLVKLIIKLIRAPCTDRDGQMRDNKIGIPQGSIISPVLANIYLHYAIDIWFQDMKQSGVFGMCNMIRYADDGIFIFESTSIAEQFIIALKERLLRFEIELNFDKTTMTPYGSRYAAKCESTGSKPPIFRFLGFVHYWIKSANRKTGKEFWRPAVKSCPHRMKKKLGDITLFIKKHRHDGNLIKETGKVITGIAGYFCVNDNQINVMRLNYQVKKMLFKWLNRRSQHGINWGDFKSLLKENGYPEKFPTKNLFFNMKTT